MSCESSLIGKFVIANGVKEGPIDAKKIHKDLIDYRVGYIEEFVDEINRKAPKKANAYDSIWFKENIAQKVFPVIINYYKIEESLANRYS